MTWSGTFDTSNQYVKYATEMIENSTNIVANTSNVTVRVWAWRTNSYGPTYGTGTLWCKIAGTQYSAAISSSQKIGTSQICLFEKTLDITHNSNGSFRLDIYSQISMDVVSSGSNGWGFDLTTIPRTSDFTITGGTLGSPITIDIIRADPSFTHWVSYDLPDGSRRSDWDGIATQHVFTPPLTDAQYLPNSATGTAKITVWTNSGGVWIGSISKTFTMYIPPSIVPTASNLALYVDGTGRDHTLNRFVQFISKVNVSFTSAATYGATISSNIITVKRMSDDGDLQTITGSNGVIANPFSLSGSYIITATVTDSRGRTATLTSSINVDAYVLPTITAFSAGRGSPTSTVNSAFNVSWTPLGTINPATVEIKNKNNVGTIATVYTLNNSTAGNVNTIATFTSQSDTSAYTYTLTVTDSFGKVATADVTIGVSFVEFCLSKGQGVGIGKVWERGSMDVGGDAYFNGNIRFNNDIFKILNGTATLNGKPVFTSDDSIIWTGASWPIDADAITPNKALSACPNGWILVWCYWNGSAAVDADYTYIFVHKSHPVGKGAYMLIGDTNYNPLLKYVYIYDTYIKGDNANNVGAKAQAVLAKVIAF